MGFISRYIPLGFKRVANMSRAGKGIVNIQCKENTTPDSGRLVDLRLQIYPSTPGFVARKSEWWQQVRDPNHYVLL